MAIEPVEITAGSGTPVATDKVGTDYYQVMKIDGGGDGVAVPIVAGQQVSAASLPVVIASDQSAIPISDNGGSLTVDNAGTFAVQAAQSGTWNVTISAAIAAGNNNIGDVDVASIAAGDNNIGNVDIVTVPTDPFGANADAASATGSISAKLRFIASTGIPITGTVTVGSHAVTNAGTFAVQESGAALTALQLIDDAVYAEDVAAQAADKGIAILAVRRDADTSLVGSDNDYANLQVDANGYLKVEIFDGGGSHTVDNAGTFAVQESGSALTALQLIDDPVFTDDTAFTPATSKVMMIGAQMDDTATDSVDEGDAGAIRMSANRNLYVRIRDNAGNERGLNIDANGALAATVTNATAANLLAQVFGAAAKDAPVSGNPVYVASRASAAAPTDVSADDDAVPFWLLRSGALAVQPTFAGVLGVAGNGASGTGVQRVTIANDSTGILATVSTVTTVSTLTGGGVAHDAGDSGNPIKVGAKAITALSGATLVASADRTDAQSDLDGALLVREHGTLADFVNGNASNTDGASTQVLAAGAAGVKHYITDVTIANTSSSNIYVELKDNTTVKWTFPVPANGGVTHAFRTPLAGTAATAWNFDPSAAASTIYCSVAGFKSKI